MERVETLLQKLQQQFTSGASAGQLLLTVQILQHELSHLNQHQPAGIIESVSVSMPLQSSYLNNKPVAPVVKSAGDEKIMEVLQVDELALEAELEEIRRNASMRQQITGHGKPHILFESDEDDIPTLSHQPGIGNLEKEINGNMSGEMESLNDSLKENKIEIADKLTALPVKDLKKAININDRFLYINELFRGDEVMYERSIKTINSFSIWPEAEYWIKRELKVKLGWTEDNETVVQFDSLVKRRFS